MLDAQPKASILIWRENRFVLFCFGCLSPNSTNAERCCDDGGACSPQPLLVFHSSFMTTAVVYTCEKSYRINPTTKKKEEKIKFETWWKIIPLVANANECALCLCAFYCILSFYVEGSSTLICPFWSTTSRKALAPNVFVVFWNSYSYLNRKLHMFWASTRRRTMQRFSLGEKGIFVMCAELDETINSAIRFFFFYFYVCLFYGQKTKSENSNTTQINGIRNRFCSVVSIVSGMLPNTRALCSDQCVTSSLSNFGENARFGTRKKKCNANDYDWIIKSISWMHEMNERRANST